MNKEQGNTVIKAERWSYLWLALAAILLVFTYGMYRNGLAACFALIFVLRFMRAKKVGRGYLLILLVLMLANIISWWNTTLENPAIFRIIMGVIIGLLYSIPFLLDRVLVRKFQGFAATLVFPLVNTAFEFLTLWPSPTSTYGSLAYSQFGNAYLNQVMSITGLWGVTFLVSWLASTVNWIWEERVDWQRIWRGAAVFGGVMLVVLLYGMLRLDIFLPEPGTVRIHAIIETDYTASEFDKNVAPLIATDPAAVKASTAPIYDRYLNATVREARAGAKIVLWPELAAVGYQEDLDALQERAQNLAREEGIYLGMGVGLMLHDPAAKNVEENRFWLIDPQGQMVMNYRKYGCLPAMRMYGSQIPVVDTPYGRIAATICCDLDFPYVIRQVSQQRADILLVPGFEPSVENLLAHSVMVPSRSIENGVSIFRATTQGLSMAIDPYGRTLGIMDDTRASERVFVVQLPNHRVITVYSLVGDLFGGLAVIGFVVILILAILRGRKQASAG